MTMFSDERVSDLSDKMFLELTKKNIISKSSSQTKFKLAIKKAYTIFYNLNDEIENTVRKKISSMSNKSVEGSDKFKVLYERLFLEEWNRH